MNSPTEKLSRALRELATDSPQGASPELGVRLNAAFARHHRIRRQKKFAVIVGIAAAFALAVMMLRTSTPPRMQVQSAQPTPAAVQPSSPAEQVAQETAPVVAHSSASHARRKKNADVDRFEPSASMPGVESGDFIALSSFDPAIPLGQAQIVRVDLPASALRSAGYPVNAEMMGRRVLTDLLVGQNGRPYAARLVQTRMVH